MKQLGTLGGGNHFIEVCLDTEDNVWLMLHSGSRNIGNEVAERHIETAKHLHKLSELPDPNLAYFVQGTEEFKNYWHDLEWAQALRDEKPRNYDEASVEIIQPMFNDQKEFRPEITVNCHHNYVARKCISAKKFTSRAKARSTPTKECTALFPARWARNRSSSRAWEIRRASIPARTARDAKCRARRRKKRFTREDLERQTAGVECRKDAGVIDEIPGGVQKHRRGDAQPVGFGRSRRAIETGRLRERLGS